MRNHLLFQKSRFFSLLQLFITIGIKEYKCFRQRVQKHCLVLTYTGAVNVGSIDLRASDNI